MKSNQSIDLAAWKKDGERLWGAVQEQKLVVCFWNNPWFRFAVPGCIFVILAIVSLVIYPSFLGVATWVLIVSPFAYTAVKYFRIGRQTGGLYSFFSETGFGIGCDADRLSIPYSAIQLPKMVCPSTVNDNYIVLPVTATLAGVMIEHKDGRDTQWDGTPYKRGIATIAIKNGVLVAEAYPNEMLVQLFCAIYPLSLYLTSITAQQTAPADAAFDQSES